MGISWPLVDGVSWNMILFSYSSTNTNGGHSLASWSPHSTLKQINQKKPYFGRKWWPEKLKSLEVAKYQCHQWTRTIGGQTLAWWGMLILGHRQKHIRLQEPFFSYLGTQKIRHRGALPNPKPRGKLRAWWLLALGLFRSRAEASLLHRERLCILRGLQEASVMMSDRTMWSFMMVSARSAPAVCCSCDLSCYSAICLYSTRLVPSPAEGFLDGAQAHLQGGNLARHQTATKPSIQSPSRPRGAGIAFEVPKDQPPQAICQGVWSQRDHGVVVHLGLRGGCWGGCRGWAAALASAAQHPMLLPTFKLAAEVLGSVGLCFSNWNSWLMAWELGLVGGH